MTTTPAILLLGLVMLGAGCVTKPDLAEFAKARPRSILVLPPLNDSTEVIASYSVLTTLTRPLGEAGYYVVPVGLADRYFRENGLTVPGEIHQIPPRKLHEVFGADAVLYVRVKQYGSKYLVLVADSTVELDARMVDARTGTQIWKCRVVQSGNGQAGIIEPLIYHLLNKLTDNAHATADVASQMLINPIDPKSYLPRGPWHPHFGKDLGGRPP
ncbi:MAG: DUF799 family lipoprotein [Verrucomicrobia bacterium]|nr:DUF799 family lipoprotein [Verrucomicrobiota bacterium]